MPVLADTPEAMATAEIVSTPVGRCSPCCSVAPTAAQPHRNSMHRGFGSLGLPANSKIAPSITTGNNAIHHCGDREYDGEVTEADNP